MFPGNPRGLINGGIVNDKHIVSITIRLQFLQ
jgi:hypothetical protein